jgi:hypothetical protein
MQSGCQLNQVLCSNQALVSPDPLLISCSPAQYLQVVAKLVQKLSFQCPPGFSEKTGKPGYVDAFVALTYPFG